MKIAIVHEMLIKKGWAEKVVSQLLEIFPEADLFTLMYDEAKIWKTFPKSKIHPSCFSLMSQRVYSLTKKQRLSLGFMRASIEKLNFDDYDRVIISSSWFAHWIKTQPHTKTVVYYHAPARYMWDWAHEYRKDIKMDKWIKWYLYGKFMKDLRVWDYNASQSNDIILANSVTTKKRISKYYRRDSKVLFPPIETERFAKKIQNTPSSTTFFKAHDYYIILSALTEFKRLDIAIKAFQEMPDIHLLIIGEGEYRKSLEGLSENATNIKFSGAQYDDDLVYLVQNSLGLVFPWEEDFWIVPIEVMAAGKPVFALSKWWLTETVILWKTGEFFDNPEGEDFIKKFQKFHQNNITGKYSSDSCKQQAQKYDTEVFKKEILTKVKAVKS